MKLPFFKGIGQKEVKEYFLALLLRDESLRAVVFEEAAGQMQMVGTGEQNLPSPLEGLTLEKLLDATDKAIGMAEASLPSGVQTHKTIFGLKETWIDNSNIKREKLVILKQLCEELDLQPIGFLVFSEAIAHLLQKQEGAPVSAVLAELGKETMTLTLLRAGRVIEVKQGPMEEPIAKSLDTLLQHFSNVEILPSRIILLDSEKRSHLAKSFISHQWSKSLPFLHVPQITALENDFETQAILYGTASQMGFSLQQMPKSRITPKTAAQMFETIQPEEEHPEETQEKPLPEEAEEEPVQEKETTEQPQANREEPADSEAFGFVTGKDVLEEAPDNPHAMPPHHGDNFTSQQEIEDETFGELPEQVKEEEEGMSRQTAGFGANATFLTEGIKKAAGQMKKIKFESVGTTLQGIAGLIKPAGTGRKGFPLLLALPLLLILILGGLLWYIFGLKATVTLVVDPKVVDADQIVTFSSTDSTDLSKNVIGGSAITVDENGSVSTDATGKKDVGDKAKGTVTIYNISTDGSKSYQAGATITASNNLKFTLDKSVTVASASGDAFSGITPGKQDVTVTAADIGTEYNLPSGTKFTIGGNVSVAAKNDKAFSGGTKKSVTVISKNDIDKLVDDLTTKLQDKAKSDLAQKADGNKSILSVFLKTQLTDKKFSGQAGDEASSVSLDGTITYTGLAYNKSDMDQLGGQLLKDKIADGHISDKGITSDVSDAEVKDGDVKATIKVKAGLIPNIDTTAIQKQLAGKSFTATHDSLSNIQQLSEVRITLSPNLFFLPKTLPRMSSHITVKVESSE